MTMPQVQDYLKTFDSRGPVRRRRRRHLRRARRRHRPLPDRARRRRRGGRRPEPGHRRHLEPPLRRQPAGRWPARRRRRTSGPTAAWSPAAGPEQPDRHLGLRLHRAARERRPGRLRPRVRPRPRPARPLRHLGQHRRRREQHGVLDPDVLRRQHRRRRPRRDRRRPTDMGAWERLHARLARAPGRPGPVLRRRCQFGESRDVVQLGPNTPVTKKPSALVMPLPARTSQRPRGARLGQLAVLERIQGRLRERR